MENLAFQLKFAGKQFEKESHRSERSSNEAKLKCKRAMEKSNMEGAKIFADTAIRQKNQSLQYLKLSSRMEAVSARVDAAVKMRRVTSAMMGVVSGMDKVLASMDPSKIAAAMDTFEKQFETLDVTTGYMDTAIGQTTSLSTPEDEVTSLMAQIADMHGLDVADQLHAASGGRSQLPAKAEAEASSAQLDLEARFSRLRPGGGQ